MKAWYLSNNNCTLRYGDGRKITEDETHTVEFPFIDNKGTTWLRPTLCKEQDNGQA